MTIPDKIMGLSDDALTTWAAFFLTQGNTLRFGGDGSDMMITERGRKALIELLKVGAVKEIEPNCSTPGREHYGTAAHNEDIRNEISRRANASGHAFFGWLMEIDFSIFKKGGEDV